MPLLPKEPDLFPPELFELPPGDDRWLVAHVRSRQEKVLGRWLIERGVAFYAPMIETETKRSGRTFRSYLPLIPGYVFVRGGAEAREAVWRSNVAANVLDVIDQEQLGEELRQIRQLQLSGATLRPYVELVPGDPVRIREGSFSGYTGVIVREKGQDRLVVRVSMLNQAVLVELDRELLRRASRE